MALTREKVLEYLASELCPWDLNSGLPGIHEDTGCPMGDETGAEARAVCYACWEQAWPVEGVEVVGC